MNNQDHSPNNSSYKIDTDHPKKNNLLVLFLSFLSLFLLITSSYFYTSNQIITKNLNSQQNEAQNTNKEEINEGSFPDEYTEYFVSDILPRYPEFANKINPDQISKTFAISLKDRSSAWVIEVKSEEDKFSHYLFSSSIQRKLQNSMVSQSGATGTCKLSEIVSVDDFLVIPSTECIAYGSGSTIAVYSLSTGDQIKLNGQNFTKPGTSWKALSEDGNTFGDLVGIYGQNKPILVVKYSEQDVSTALAYFDLKTGYLLNKEIFN